MLGGPPRHAGPGGLLGGLLGVPPRWSRWTARCTTALVPVDCWVDRRAGPGGLLGGPPRWSRRTAGWTAGWITALVCWTAGSTAGWTGALGDNLTSFSEAPFSALYTAVAPINSEWCNANAD